MTLYRRKLEIVEAFHYEAALETCALLSKLSESANETFTGIDQTSRATWSFFVSNVVAVERASSPTKAPTTLMLLLRPV